MVAAPAGTSFGNAGAQATRTRESAPVLR